MSTDDTPIDPEFSRWRSALKLAAITAEAMATLALMTIGLIHVLAQIGIPAHVWAGTALVMLYGEFVRRRSLRLPEKTEEVTAP